MWSRLKHMAFDVAMLIEPVREALQPLGIPYVIENVEGAPLLNPITLCGSSFGLRIQRHRDFESNVALNGLPCDHRLPAMNPHNQAGRDAMYEEFGRCDPEPRWREEMGVGWMSRYEGREAIPPVFTEHIGRQLIAHLGRVAA
jgi:DNA (cytosine-5)-methyltransferase 1